MSKHYFSGEQDELYRQGKNDEKHHRRNYSHDRYSENDRPYFDGRDDEAREERQRREEEEEERQERERQERLEFQRYVQEQQETDYYDQLINDANIDREIEEMSNMDLDAIFPEFPDDDDI